MNNQINERIIIANDFKWIYNWKGKLSGKKEKTLKRIAFLDHGIALFLLTVSIFTSAMSTFQIETFFIWAEAGVLVLITMGFSLRARFSYIELMLQRHIKKIENIDIQFDEKINNEFANIIAKFNKNRKQNIFILGLFLFLIFTALLQVIGLNPYWEKFPPLVLALSLYLMVRINYDIMILKRNLERVEFMIDKENKTPTKC